MKTQAVALITGIETSTPDQRPKGKTQMNRISTIMWKLVSIAPKAALLVIVVLGSLAASPMAFAACSYTWAKSTILQAPGLSANFSGTLNGISLGIYYEVWTQSGNFTGGPVLQTPTVAYNGISVPAAGWVALPQSPMNVSIHGIVPPTATTGQTGHVTMALYDINFDLLCYTTVTVEAVNAPALSTEMNTIGGDNEVDEYYKGVDLNVYQLSWPGTWKSANITQLSGAPIADVLSPIASQVDAAYNSYEVFYLDPNQNIWEAYFDNGRKTWSSTDITAVTGTPAAKAGSTIVSVVNPYAGSIQLNYLDSGGHIRQLWSWNRKTWYGNDLTSQTGAPIAAAGSPLFTLNDTAKNWIEVYYLDTNNYVRGLSFSSSGGWVYFNPSPGYVSPAQAGSALVGVVNPYAGSVQVNYVDSAGRVDQLYSWDRQTWAGGPVLTTAPNAAPGSGMATEVNTIAGSVEVYYLDSTQTVSELWWQASSGWHFSNPTVGTGAPNAAAGSPVVSLVNTRANTVQVHYIAPDKHVHELWWNGSWHADDVTLAAGAYPAIP
jgi:hypothetical protein